MASDKALSKFLSWALRHEPAAAGLSLDPAGWAPVDAVLRATDAHGSPATRAELERVVRQSDKQRFELDGERIRARQGHSVPVELGHPIATPPKRLFHGTVDRFLPAIRAEGLVPGKRHAVHLSEDRATAGAVGGRRGRPVVLTVQAAALHRSGVPFRRSPNGVWLVDAVPPEHLSVEAVRIATPDDAEAIADLHVDSWQSAYRGLLTDEHLDGLDRAQWRERRRFQLERGGPRVRNWVRTVDDRVVGWAVAGPCRDEDVDPSRVMELFAIYLSPTAFGGGHGWALWEHVLEFARDKRFDEVLLHALEGNARARRFYALAGFALDEAAGVQDFHGAASIRMRRPVG